MADDDSERSRLVDAYRRVNAAPASRREQVLARVLAPGGVGVFVGGARPTGAPWAVILLGVAAAVLAVLALEAITGGVAVRLGRAPRFVAADGAERVREAALATPAAPTARAATAPVPAAAPVPAELPIASPPAASVDASLGEGEPSAVPVQRPRGVVPSTTPPAAPVPAATALAAKDEPALMDEARRAMRRRGWVDARNALTEHAAAFPAGTHAAERRALLVVVACRLDPSEDSWARARAFLDEEPGSSFVHAVTVACRPSDAVRVVSPFD
jgi:hypothetical protein